MKTDKVRQFDCALYGVGDKIERILAFISDEKKEEIQEIRLRKEKPLAVTVFGKSYFVRADGALTRDKNYAVTVKESDLEEAFIKLTQNSVYSHIKEIKQGFVMMKNGCRAGIAGNFSEQAGITDISSVNIRIARQIKGVADALYENYEKGGVLICGAPGSGKTTLLRDFIRLVSDGGKRVAVVDSRGEISASFKGVCQNDIGVNTDVLLGFNKADGIEKATRTLFPNLIAFDEIGSVEEAKEVENCLFGGVDIVTTVHIDNIKEIFRRNVTKKLLGTGAVNLIVILESDRYGEYKIYTLSEVKKACGFYG
ncbi:MAG: hypothetical protein E7568_01915 [Ruminococcaceae bacterium]|nr:hypothetical protein [Oscillospiraceae bacterium]